MGDTVVVRQVAGSNPATYEVVKNDERVAGPFARWIDAEQSAVASYGDSSADMTFEQPGSLAETDGGAEAIADEAGKPGDGTAGDPLTGPGIPQTAAQAEAEAQVAAPAQPVEAVTGVTEAGAPVVEPVDPDTAAASAAATGDAEPVPADEADKGDVVILAELNVDQLQDELRARDLPVSGTKDELIARITEHDAQVGEATPPAE